MYKYLMIPFLLLAGCNSCRSEAPLSTPAPAADVTPANPANPGPVPAATPATVVAPADVPVVLAAPAGS